ncbi:hypothetical protein CYMTET_29960 [Cymbomonas tetramitiformis]|uniref:Prolyl 3,4-dihydroxylase TPA1/OFD1 N-terminal domain-containing protein n=1 Tax=Cymbomonas tetramitiformis TaxID=36881 RepID=A0AAE0KUE7_9CHLO|nr:hypothetical protein CYMTET_29960 [Cymbomonas tetramitiformis]
MLGKVVDLELRNITDMFLTTFAEGDFLSTHSDPYSGTIAFALMLTKDWPAEGGGQLEFTCVNCPSFVPEFNTLLMFRTRPVSMPHTVRPISVIAARNQRYSATGWFMGGDDRMSSTEMEQHKKMKGRVFRLSNHSLRTKEPCKRLAIKVLMFDVVSMLMRSAGK